MGMTTSADALLGMIGIALPIVQAPMAGVSTPAMAAAVSAAGALGSIAAGTADAAAMGKAIAEVRARTDRPFNVNVFCHEPAVPDRDKEAAWLGRLRPEFARFGAKPPLRLAELYTSFLEDDAMLALFLAERPKVVSFHFGVPSPSRIAALRDAGIVLLACATNVDEARHVADAGVHAVVAQGYEAGGHRGLFDPTAVDEMLGTTDLLRRVLRAVDRPVIAAGGIGSGGDIARLLAEGAAAAQVGTLFVTSDESLADAGYRAALATCGASDTVMTRAISGRPARCIRNRFTALGETVSPGAVPDYSIAYDAGKALNAAAKAAGEPGFGAHWAGTGAPHARPMAAAEIVERLANDLRRATT